MKPRFRKVHSSEWESVIGNRVDWAKFSFSARTYRGLLRFLVDGKKAVMRRSDDVWFVEVAQ